MLDFTYENKTEILFGKNKVDLLGKTVKKYNFKNVLVVYGGGSALKSGLIDRVTSQLKEEHIGYSLVGGVCENPTSDFVYEAIDFVKKNNIDLVLAVGGGSVIDASKAIGAGAVYDGDFWDFFRSKDRLVIERTLPVAVVLTMAAAGSENSESIVITNKELQEKRGNIKTSVVRPIFTIEDPLLTLTLPKYNTACGIVDMMVHIMERYFSNTENVMVTDSLCEGLLKSILSMGIDLINDLDNYDLRANIMWASTIAHNNILGMDREQDWASHRIEHELSTKYNLAHGAGLAVVVPRWMRYVSKRNDTKFKSFAKNVMEVDTIDDAINKLEDFFKALGIPTTLEEIGYKESDLDSLIDTIDYRGDTLGFYVPLSKEDIRNIYLGNY